MVEMLPRGPQYALTALVLQQVLCTSSDIRVKSLEKLSKGLNLQNNYMSYCGRRVSARDCVINQKMCNKPKAALHSLKQIPLLDEVSKIDE